MHYAGRNAADPRSASHRERHDAAWQELSLKIAVTGWFWRWCCSDRIRLHTRRIRGLRALRTGAILLGVVALVAGWPPRSGSLALASPCGCGASISRLRPRAPAEAAERRAPHRSCADSSPIPVRLAIDEGAAVAALISCGLMSGASWLRRSSAAETSSSGCQLRRPGSARRHSA